MSKKGGKSTPSGKEKEKSRITPSNELIPGIADAEWLVFQETELRDVTVAAVLGEIIDESLNEIVDRHTSARAIDTAVNDVMGILSDAMRLHFITHDAEPLILNDDPAPKPTKTDSWARGRIPVVLNSTTRLKESVSRVSTGVNVRFNSSKQAETQQQASAAPMVSSGLTDITRGDSCPEMSPRIRAGNVIPVQNTRADTALTSGLVKHKKQSKRYTGRIQSGPLKNITTPLGHDEEQLLKSKLMTQPNDSMTGAPASFNTIWKVMQNRPSNKDLVQFDADGNVRSITKLSNRALPKLQKSRPDVKISDTQIIKAPTLMKDKNRHYRVASLRPVSGSTNILRQNKPFELAPGVSLQESKTTTTTVHRTQSDHAAHLRPMKPMANVPLDHQAIVN